MTISDYIAELNKEYKTGRATEHTYRGYLQTLIKSISSDVMVTNEPVRIKCGAPDYIITKKDIPIGYIEAKDIGVDLSSKAHHEQFERYRKSLNNLIITDYLDFWLYIDGVFVKSIRIGAIEGRVIRPLPEHFIGFTALVNNFCLYVGQTIKSSKKLAEMMAGKARMLSDVFEKALIADEEDKLNPDTALQSQLTAFKDILIHDITPKGFADIYAQTIAYGMFAARLHDLSLTTFTRQEAAELIPKSNPFLRKLFQYVAGYDLDVRLVWIVDGLADIFRATDLVELLKNFGQSTQATDPIIHFYETFLTEYDPELRRSRGVWYTPEPIVNFIVRAVDDVLKNEFSLKKGLADISKTKIKVNLQATDKRYRNNIKTIEQDVHRVQILDPSTGTGTFLAEVIKNIHQKFEGQQGNWSKYVDEHLMPRLNGFELLMASYAMAHLKLDMLLLETGYKQSKEQRFKIYLTNSLEEHHKDTGTLFASWLSSEANEANQIKRDTPVMVVIGNPPYSGESSNKGEWITELMEDYKKEPGGVEKLKERNSKWINDDYVKFLRLGQHLIEKNGEGVLAFINPHGFLDSPTFRGMRWNLLKTYDKIYTIDLHGNSTKKETSPDGTVDVNVFDIMQGVSINIFIKQKKKRTTELAELFHYEIFGRRDDKYSFLKTNSLASINFDKITPTSPMYFMVKKNLNIKDRYEAGFKVSELFLQNSLGFVTARDNFTLYDSELDGKKVIGEFLSLDDETARTRFQLGKDVRDWKVSFARRDLLLHYPNKGSFVKVSYRPFDEKYTFYTGKSKGFHCYPRNEIMQHILTGQNIALNLCKNGRALDSHVYFLSIHLTDKNLASSLDSVNVFPLYLYERASTQKQLLENPKRKPNLNQLVVKKIETYLGLRFEPEERKDSSCFLPIDLLDYIYAVLYSPKYRDTFKEFLKIDFPYIPFPKDFNKFWDLVLFGRQLRLIHLLESEIIEEFITRFPVEGTNIVDRAKFDYGKVYINSAQYFENVPAVAWDLYIGGYQPAQKWLKDRKGKVLGYEDIQHYQKIVVALTETERIMKKIDEIDFL